MKPGRVALIALATAALYAFFRLCSWDGARAEQTRKDLIFSDHRRQRPGVRHHIRLSDLPSPHVQPVPVANGPDAPAARPASAWPTAPPGFVVELYVSGPDAAGHPSMEALLNAAHRLLRTAPNGDVFAAGSWSGKVHVYRGVDKRGRARQRGTFATDIPNVFGIAFYPPGPNPRWVYVANDQRVLRFRYVNGDMKARGPRQTVVELPRGGHLRGGGHWTRDVAFSLDGRKMYVSVGSRSNIADTDNNPDEYHRADILEFNPDGSGMRVFAWGVRNAVGIAVHPRSGELWGSVNERDSLGDDLPPDYITHFENGGFYGWPWYYIGGNPDPRHKGKHPELRGKVIIPDVLIQPHNASLQMTFYTGQQFPAAYHGDIFASEHGSWNRSVRTGYEVIRVPMHAKTRATGEYEDFLTGFVTPQGRVWGRPVGITVAKDGALLVSDDWTGSIWRVRWVGPPPPHGTPSADNQ